MFTGLIEEIGEIVSVKRDTKTYKLSVCANRIFEDLKLGDSVAVNGVCLTASTISGNVFTADVMPETIERTALSKLKSGSRVNLERAMPLNGRFGGHIVAGHIDGVGVIMSKKQDSNAVRLTITAKPEILKYIVEKGSIAINGVSLTVTYVDSSAFGVSIIPHTSNETTLLSYEIGTAVNLECDIVGKYIEKLMNYGNSEAADNADKTSASGGIDMEFLSRCGF